MAKEVRIQPTPVVSKPTPVRFVRNSLKKGEAALPNFAKNAALTAASAVLFRPDPIRKETTDITSYLGTPVYDQVVIQAGSYFEIEDINGENPIEYDAIVMQTVLVDISMSKNIIATPIQGLNGTIKEYVSMGDYHINIQGNIVGETYLNTVRDIGSVYPLTDTKLLAQICQVGKSINITSQFLNEVFDINEVVVTDFKFAQAEGFRNQQPFQLSLLSDQPIDLSTI